MRWPPSPPGPILAGSLLLLGLCAELVWAGGVNDCPATALRDVVTPEFTGKVCRSTPAPSAAGTVEYREGQWVLPEGGTLTGSASSQAGFVTRTGQLRSPAFEGTLTSEFRVAGGTTTLTEQRQGSERFSDGCVFDGTTATRSTSDSSGIPKTTVEKTGRLTCSASSASLRSSLVRVGGLSGTETLTETRHGHDTLPEGGDFDGTIQLERTTTASGTTQRVTRQGTWTLTSGQRLTGSLISGVDASGQWTVTDQRTATAPASSPASAGAAVASPVRTPAPAVTAPMVRRTPTATPHPSPLVQTRLRPASRRPARPPRSPRALPSVGVATP